MASLLAGVVQKNLPPTHVIKSAEQVYYGEKRVYSELVTEANTSHGDYSKQVVCTAKIYVFILAS